MSRVLLIIVFLLWMLWSPDQPTLLSLRPLAGLGAFVSVYALLVIIMGLWGRWLARQVHAGNLQRSLRRFNDSMEVARYIIPVWFAVGVYVLGWGKMVHDSMRPLDDWRFDLPAILAGTFPAFLAWMGLWWSQFPADRAIREQAMQFQIEASGSAHALPGFWDYFASNIRLQLLFTIVPILLIVLTRDLIFLTLRGFHFTRDQQDTIQGILALPAALVIFVFAPEILRRIASTRPLAPSPLRTRLEAICQRCGLRYKDILLWHTHGNMANALVMGLVPRVRYILLSDLLLETMTDEQIEAVFAHEAGHVRHRHIAWFGVFSLLMLAVFAGPGLTISNWLDALKIPPWALDLPVGVAGAAMYMVVFFFLSQRFERQADVFAARTMQSHWDQSDHVGQFGSEVFASALRHVALVNNMSLKRKDPFHGSIVKRIGYLQRLSEDPQRTADFDRSMGRVYWAIVVAIVVFGTWAGAAAWREAHLPASNGQIEHRSERVSADNTVDRVRNPLSRYSGRG